MSSHGQSGEQKLIAGFFLGPSSFFRITPDKSLGPYRERAGGQRPANRKNARGRSVHDTATCTKPPRGLAGQLPYGDSIDRVCLAILTHRWVVFGSDESLPGPEGRNLASGRQHLVCLPDPEQRISVSSSSAPSLLHVERLNLSEGLLTVAAAKGCEMKT
jgi:hypothetical protein